MEDRRVVLWLASWCNSKDSQGSRALCERQVSRNNLKWHIPAQCLHGSLPRENTEMCGHCSPATEEPRFPETTPTANMLSCCQSCWEHMQVLGSKNESLWPPGRARRAGHLCILEWTPITIVWVSPLQVTFWVITSLPRLLKLSKDVFLRLDTRVPVPGEALYKSGLLGLGWCGWVP